MKTAFSSGNAARLAAAALLVVGACRRSPVSPQRASVEPVALPSPSRTPRALESPIPCAADLAVRNLRVAFSEPHRDGLVVRVAGTLTNLGPGAWKKGSAPLVVHIYTQPSHPDYGYESDLPPVEDMEVGEERVYEAYRLIPENLPADAELRVAPYGSVLPENEKNCRTDNDRLEMGASEIRKAISDSKAFPFPRTGTIQVLQWSAMAGREGAVALTLRLSYGMNAPSGSLEAFVRNPPHSSKRYSVPVEAQHSRADLLVPLSCREDLGPSGAFDIRLVLRNRAELPHVEKSLMLAFREVCGPGPPRPNLTPRAGR